MPMYNKLELGRKARELGFVRDTFEKMSRLTVILQYINSEQELNSLLALRGGTAINLTIFSLPRLSVDIDLDFSETANKEEMLVKRERINELLGRYMANEEYTLSDKSKFTHSLDSFVYSYANAAGNTDNIKIEVDYSLRNHILPVSTVTAKTDGVFPDFPIRTVSQLEIYAGKTVALSDRAAARDLFDLYNMLCSNLFDESDMSLLRKCSVFYLAITGDPPQKFSLTKLDTITERMVRTDLYPMIRSTEKFDFVSAKSRVSSYLSELMELTESETAFLNRFSEGHYIPELLFEDSEILKRIGNHPMALWRLRHIQQSK